MRKWFGLAFFALLAAGACGKVKPSPASETCSAPTTLCGGRCVDIATDPANCGVCGGRCSGADQCVEGACRITGCPGTETDCSGQCVNLKTSAANCGSCANACTGSEVCENGVCICPMGRQFCNGVCTDVRMSDAHCGGCNLPCSPDSTCLDAICEQRCNPPLVSCDSRCVDLSTDSSACGGCGVQCPPGEQCVAGRCGCATGTGYTACGVECVDLTSNPSHCGSCGKTCAAGEFCRQGSCSRCSDGFFFCPDATGDPLTMCMAQASTANERCQCDRCLAQLVACREDPRCGTAWGCAKQFNCTTPCWGAFTQCGGGTGRFNPGGLPADTTQRLDALFNCMQANQCGY